MSNPYMHQECDEQIEELEQRIAELEAQNAELKLAMVVYAREELGNMCFEDDSEVVEYFLEYAKAEDK